MEMLRKSNRTAILASLLLVGSAQAVLAQEVDFAGGFKQFVEGLIPGNEFLDILEHSPELAVAAVEIKIGVKRNEIALSNLSTAEKEARLKRLDEAASLMSKAKASNQHADQGKDPFLGIFTSNVPLGPTLPTDITLTLDPNTASAFIVKPQIWGGDIANPVVTSALVQVHLGAGGFTLLQHSYQMGTFDVLGMPAGPSAVHLRSGAATSFAFDPSTGGFTAHYEGYLVNDLYPLSNPIVFISDTAGEIMPDGIHVVQMTQDPWIVPGVPGSPPLDHLGMAYIGTRAKFDAATGTLTFGDNVDPSALPDVTVVREPNGTYISAAGGGEQLFGANLALGPLQYLGIDGSGRYRFADTTFRLLDASGLLAQGTIANIGIDPNTFHFGGEAVLDSIPGAVTSSLLANFPGNVGSFQFLGSEATLDLLASTELFTIGGDSPSDFVNFHPSPEPGAWVLCLSGSASLFGCLRRRRTSKRARTIYDPPTSPRQWQSQQLDGKMLDFRLAFVMLHFGRPLF